MRLRGKIKVTPYRDTTHFPPDALRADVPTNLKRGGVSTNLERDAEIDGDLADITVLVPVQHNGTTLLAIIDNQRG